MIFYDHNRNRVELVSELGRGGEASIYQVRGRKDLVAKIYHRSPYTGYVQKLTWMQTHPPKDPVARPGYATIAWPIELLYDHAYHLKGYLMPYVAGTVKLINVINPLLRTRVLPNFNWKYLIRTSRNLASVVRALHEKNYVIGDLNESNILITPSAMVTLIDVDSFQVLTTHDNRIYSCPVGKPEYTPSELQGVNFQNVVRKPEADYFALSVLIFQLLMQGSHPFRGRWMGKGEPPQIAEKIKNGWFPYFNNGKKSILLPPPNAPTLDVLSPSIKELFLRCFVNGHTSPSKRPTPQMWMDVLEKVEAGLSICSKGHYYDSHLQTCPWCSHRTKKISVTPVKKPEGIPRLNIRKGIIYLGVIAHGENTRSQLLIKNDGNALLSGKVESDRKWLQPSSDHFVVAPGEIKKLELFASTRTLRKNPKGSSHQAVLKINSNGGDQRLKVRIRVGVPVLQVEPVNLDFGSLQSEDLVQKSILIKNSGSGMLNGKLSTRAAWLTASSEQFSCLPGASISITLKADASLVGDALSDGNSFSSIFISSNGGYQSIRAKMRIAQPRLTLEENMIQLGKVSQGEQKYFKIKIKNTGTGELHGKLQIDDFWIKHQGQSFLIPSAGESAVTLIADTAGLEGLPAGKQHTARVKLISNDGDRTLPIWITVNSARLGLKKNELNLGLLEKGSNYSAELVLENTGSGNTKVHIDCQDGWISIPNREVNCPGEGQIAIPFRLDTGFPGVPVGREVISEIRLISGIQEQRFQVRFRLDAPQLKLLIHDLERGNSFFQGKSKFRFLIQNQSKAELSGKIESTVPWLVINQEQFRIKDGMQTVVCTLDRRQLSEDAQKDRGMVVIESNAGNETIAFHLDRHVMALRILHRILILNLSEDVSMQFQYIPPGDFVMGDNVSFNDQERNLLRGEKILTYLTMNEYWIGKYAVTNQQYQTFVLSQAWEPPAGWKGQQYPAEKADHPVVGVSWRDAQAFCSWMHGVTGCLVHLPTEPQWERAARGDESWIYPWGNEAPDRDRCNYEGADTVHVASYGQAGESSWGVANMSGNVWEWTASQARPYPYQPDDGRESLTGENNRILRGGSWFSSTDQVRSTCRFRGKVNQKESFFGFRCALTR